MRAWVRNDLMSPASEIDLVDFCTGGGFWEPVIVETRKEADYLFAMMLMVGNEFEVCVDGIDQPKRDTPPSWLSIPHL